MMKMRRWLNVSTLASLVFLFCGSQLFLVVRTEGFNCLHEASVTYTTKISHEGNLIIQGNEVFEIKDCEYVQTGNITVRDSASLIIQNALLNMSQEWDRQFWIRIENNASFMMTESEISGPHELRIRCIDRANVSISNSTITWMGDHKQGLIELFDSSLLSVAGSTVNYVGSYGESSVEIGDSNVTDSVYVAGGSVVLSHVEVYRVGLAFLASLTNVTIGDLHPDNYGNWDLCKNNTIVNANQNLTLIDALVHNWYVGTWGDYCRIQVTDSLLMGASSAGDFSSVSIIDSTVTLWIQAGESASLNLMNSSYTGGSVLITDQGTITKGWYLDILAKSDSFPIEGAMIEVFYNDNGSLAAQGATVEDGSVRFGLYEKIMRAETTQIVNNYTVRATTQGDVEESAVILTSNEKVEFLFPPMMSAPLISQFKTLFENNTVRMIYPSDQIGKPLVLGPAMLSDWTASGFVYTKLKTVSEGEDTNPSFLNQTTGKPLGSSGIGLVTFGGPDVNMMTYYAETEDNAPIHFMIGTDRFSFTLRNGTSIPGADLPKTVLESEDMFVIEVFEDCDRRYQMIFQGFGWKGTYAAGKYFDRTIYPSLETHNESWTIVKWNDANGDGFVNAPGDGDTYAVVTSGNGHQG